MNEKTNKTVRAWVEKADHDLGSAKIIYKFTPDYYDTIAFHCQQAVEKYLKATLLFYEIEFKKTHDLIYLCNLLPDSIQIPDELKDGLNKLSGFGVEVRSPDIVNYLSKEELRYSISIAEKSREFLVNGILRFE